MLRKILANFTYHAAHLSLGLGRLGHVHAHRLMRLTRRLWPAHPAVGPWLDYMDGSLLLSRGRPEEALTLLRAAARGLPGIPGIRVRTGIAYTMLGRDDEAIAILEKSLAEEAVVSLPDLWTSLAWSYLRTGRIAQAMGACRRAEQAEINSPRVQFIARLALGMQIGAVATGELRDMLQTIPEGIPLLLEYARLQAVAGRHRLAKSAISAMPEELQARSYVLLGQASLNAEDHQTALWASEQLVEMEADDAQTSAALLRAEAFLQAGRTQEALEVSHDARERFGSEARIREQLGRVLLISGNWEAAVEEMIEALHLGGGSALAAGLAALASLELGDAASARGVFIVQRLGDGLACAFSHTAQVRLLVLDNQWDEALGLAESALHEITQLPAWAAVPAVRTHLGMALRVALQVVRDGGTDPQRLRAADLLRQLNLEA